MQNSCAKIPRSVHKEELHSPVPRFLIVSSICASEALRVSVPKIDRQISSGCKTFTVFLGRFAFSFSEQNSFDYLSYKFHNAIASSVVPGSCWKKTQKGFPNEKSLILCNEPRCGPMLHSPLSDFRIPSEEKNSRIREDRGPN